MIAVDHATQRRLRSGSRSWAPDNTRRVKIMFASLGAYGHRYPMFPLALACADAGHEAMIATGPPFLGQLPLPTVSGYPPHLELDWAIQEARRVIPIFTVRTSAWPCSLM